MGAVRYFGQLRVSCKGGVGSADAAASISSEGRFEDGRGDRNVSVTMRGRFIGFLWARCRVRRVRNGEPVDIAEGLRDDCPDI